MTDLVLTGNKSVALAKHDYRRFLAEYGIDQDRFRQWVERDEDRIDMPEVYDKLVLGPSEIDGLGLYSRGDYLPGELLAVATVDGMRTDAGRYTNHSPYPNAHLVPLVSGDLLLVACAPMRAGEEVTIDYRQAAQVNGSNLRPIRAEVESTLRQKIELMEKEMSKCEAGDLPLRHFFIDGTYAREMSVPAGTLWTGATHKFDQINIMSKGDMSVLTAEGVVRIMAPFTYVAPAGSKRMGYAHEDSVWTTILSSNGSIAGLDLDEIEHMFVAKSEDEYLEYLRLQHSPALLRE